ncbi:unnamed protein product [Cutaneotrichosporon oleaginosum]
MSFSSFPLESLGLKQQYASACARAGLATASDVLLAAPADLAKKLRSTSGVPIQIPDLVQAVAQAIAPQVHTAATLLTPPSEVEEGAVPTFVSTGDAALDSMLGGGVRVGAITEITGESAAGKSHLTLALAVAAQLPPHAPSVESEEGLQSLPRSTFSPGGTIIMTSERILATSRLAELAEGMRASIANSPTVEEILDNVHTSRVGDIDALEHALAFVIPPMLAQRRRETYFPLLGQRTAPRRPMRDGRGVKPIRLLIIDSITALLRGQTEGSTTSLAQRSLYLSSIADRLKALAVAHELAVVVVNQVKDVFAPGFGVGLPTPSNLPGVRTPNGLDGGTRPTDSYPSSSQGIDPDEALPPMLYATQARHFSGQSPGVAKEAALGIVWAISVNTRLMLARTGRRRILSDDDLRSAKRARSDHPLQHQTSETEEKVLVRRIHLVFSPFAHPATLDYVILGDGIHCLPSSLRLVDLGPAIRRRDLRLRAALDDPADELPAHIGSDIYDEMDIPPELWEGLDDEADEAPSSPAIGEAQ